MCGHRWTIQQSALRAQSYPSSQPTHEPFSFFVSGQGQAYVAITPPLVAAELLLGASPPKLATSTVQWFKVGRHCDGTNFGGVIDVSCMSEYSQRR